MPEFFGVEWTETETDGKDEMYVADANHSYVKEQLSNAGFSWVSLTDFDSGTYHGDDLNGARAQVGQENAYLFVPDRPENEEEQDYKLFDMDGFHGKGSPK